MANEESETFSKPALESTRIVFVFSGHGLGEEFLFFLRRIRVHVQRVKWLAFVRVWLCDVLVVAVNQWWSTWEDWSLHTKGKHF